MAEWDNAPIVSEAPKAAATSGGNPWDAAPIVQQAETPKPAGKGILQKGAEEVAAGADMALSLPGAVLGPLAAATGRWVAIAKGAGAEDASSFGHEFGQAVQEKLSNPIQSLLEHVGYKGGYSESNVSGALSKASEVVGKGASWLADKSGIPKADAEDLVNAASMLLVPGAVKLTAKALTKTAGVVKGTPKVAPEEPTLRDTPENKPTPPKSDATPADLAKQHIEETTGVAKAKEATPEYEKARRADARAAFAEDPQYADYLKNYAEEEARLRTLPNELAADRYAEKVRLAEGQVLFAEQAREQQGLPKMTTMESATVKLAAGKAFDMTAEERIIWEKTPSGLITNAEALAVMRKPGTERTTPEIITLQNYRKQGGKADPELLAKMAAVGLGVTAGLALDPEHPIEGALLGALGGFGASKVAISPKASVAAIKQAFSTDTRIRITEFGDAHEVAQAKAGRAIWQSQDKILSGVPLPERRSAVTHWMQGDKSIPLTNAEYKAAVEAKTFFDEMGKAGVDSGVLSNLIPDYVTNLWDLEGTNKAVWGKLASGPGMSETSKFNLQRKITSIAEGKALGLKPLTEDVAQIMGIYGNSLSRTMANKQLMESLRGATVPGGASKLLMPAPEAPKGYVPVNHPQMRGQLVHPDIAPSMDFMFQQKTPSGLLAGIEGINTALKRVAVSGSLFHAKTLIDAYIGAGGNLAKIPGMAKGTSQYLKQVKEGGAGDMVDKALEGGLKFSVEKGRLADEDVGGSFYTAMEKVRGAVDEVVPGAGKLVKGFENVNHAVDTLMWERLHAGMKLEIFAKNYEVLRQNNVAAHTKNPTKVPLKTSKEISTIAASQANDLFGGLNWRRAAEEARTQFGRDASLAAYGPSGRRVMQIAMFAPDWTISTTRAALKAFGPGTGLKGLVKPQELADLHRQYLARSALYYFTAGNAVNYAMSGHGISQNKDMTTLELGDGRTMQFSKHMMEPVHWITKPGQQALNKLGFLPSEGIEQATGTEYLSAKGTAPKMEPGMTGHARHLLKRLVPISAAQGDAGAGPGISGALGFPIYGMTEEQKDIAREKKVEKRRKQKESEE